MKYWSNNVFSAIGKLALSKENSNCRIYEKGNIKNSKRIYCAEGSHLTCQFLCHTFLEEQLFCQQRINQDFDSFEYIVSGNFFFQHDQHTIRAEAGDLVFLPAGADNTLLYLPAYGPCEKFGLIPGGSMYSSLKKLFNLESFSCTSFDDQNRIKSFLERLWEKAIRLNGTVTGEEIGGMIYEFLQIASTPSGSSGESLLLRRIRHFIEENLEQEITPSLLAEKFHLPQHQLRKLFNEGLHMPPNQYLISRRMARAAVLLGDSSLRINEIAFAAGYRDPLYFSTEFHRFYGISPREYRKKLLQKFTH